jgi:hypothetical protein
MHRPTTKASTVKLMEIAGLQLPKMPAMRVHIAPLLAKTVAIHGGYTRRPLTFTLLLDQRAIIASGFLKNSANKDRNLHLTFANFTETLWHPLAAGNLFAENLP